MVREDCSIIIIEDEKLETDKYREDPEAENQLYTKPCPYNKAVPCVQYPETGCGCDPCVECEVRFQAGGNKDAS